ncbi:MAG: peptidylprolyl isomerase [Paludibacteraceae bacterium]|nr:peptidylprolyl isomerase [Paludibacteraceae bacterium]
MKTILYKTGLTVSLILSPFIVQSQTDSTLTDSAGATASTPSSQGKIIDEVVWVVGNEAVLRSDVEKQVQQLRYERVDMGSDPYCRIPEHLAVQKLFLHQADLDSIEANEVSIKMQVDQRMAQVVSQIGSEEKVAEYYGKSIKQLREDLYEQARDQSRMQQVQQKIVGDHKLTPSDVRKYWETEMQSEDIPTIPTKVEVQVLAMEPKMTLKETEALKERLREMRRRVESGDASFSMLATLYSDDAGSAKVGGELGFMGKGQLVEPFANELFSMNETKNLSRIVESEFGFHIIQFIERRGDKINCRHILLKPKASDEEKQRILSRMDSALTLIRDGKVSFEDAVYRWSEDKDTKMNEGLMENSQDGSSKFEYQALPDGIAREVHSLQVGEISQPFFMENSKGKQVCAIVKLKSRTEQHKANLKDDYQQMKNYVQNQKNEKILQEWVKEKQKETYIRISPELQGCDWTYPGWLKNTETGSK